MSIECCPECSTFEGHSNPCICGYGKKSLELQAVIIAAGYVKDDHATSQGINLVNKIAKTQGLRQWHNINSIAGYDALIAAAREHLPPKQEATP